MNVKMMMMMKRFLDSRIAGWCPDGHPTTKNSLQLLMGRQLHDGD